LNFTGTALNAGQKSNWGVNFLAQLISNPGGCTNKKITLRSLGRNQVDKLHFQSAGEMQPAAKTKTALSWEREVVCRAASIPVCRFYGLVLYKNLIRPLLHFDPSSRAVKFLRMALWQYYCSNIQRPALLSFDIQINLPRARGQRVC
jgi:hypothetical protein